MMDKVQKHSNSEGYTHIKAAKKLHYNKIILNSTNKIKITCNIVKTETGKNESKKGIHLLSINGIITHN
jgi:hypothetical protein